MEHLGSTKNGVKNAGQKIGSVVLGKKDTNPYTRDKDGNSDFKSELGDRSGGIVGAVVGDKTNANVVEWGVFLFLKEYLKKLMMRYKEELETLDMLLTEIALLLNLAVPIHKLLDKMLIQAMLEKVLQVL